MKRRLKQAAVLLALLAVAFGGGYLARQGEVATLEREVTETKQKEEQTRVTLARQSVGYELCRASAEAAHANFGHATERLQAAKRAAQAVPELKGIEARLDEAITAARKVEADARAKIEALLGEVAKD